MIEPRRVVESVVRHSYGRLLSYLAARSRDVASAEDALSEAVLAALKTWPEIGVPDKPEAWLLQAARRRLIDGTRLHQTRNRYADELRRAVAEAEDLTATRKFPDERLKLLFVCAHPAIDVRVHTPLMLQVVLGLDAEAIGAAFLCPGATMGQRLSRAKAKIRDARIAFEVPTGPDLQHRLGAVLEAIYAAYTHGWDDIKGADAQLSELTEEAIWLARMLKELVPEDPEVLGLLALFLYCDARRAARRDAHGEYVPISRQNTDLWDSAMLAEAEQLLSRAATHARHGRFQLEAAVQSAPIERMRGKPIDWEAIAHLYEGLVRVAPTFGALLGRAAAVAEVHGPSAGLALLEAIPFEAVKEYQPYWAARGHLLQRLGRITESITALNTAVRLTVDPATRAFLERQAQPRRDAT